MSEQKKSLVIAEKPSVARDIARVLGCGKKGNGCLEGGRYVVTWALGHLVTLSAPEEYDKKYQKWEMETLPMIPKETKLSVIPQTGKQYRAVKEQLFRKDIGEIIIATDAGREGELVARWILEKSGCKKPLKRLWISSVTDRAIREGFAHLQDGRDYEPLYHAAEARAQADWLVGMNGTRALTCRYNAQLSCGRVQTPTLAMIAKREEEIRSFQGQDYYGLTLAAGGIRWSWQDKKSGAFRTFRQEKMQELKQKTETKDALLRISSVEKKQKQQAPAGLYDLTTLQREASQKYGFSPKQTLNIMQRLYENHKVLTYPRTDSKYIGTDVVPTLKERISACGVGPYKALAGKLARQPITGNKSFVDDRKVSDHHAIIPTEQFVQMEHMTVEERRIYDMVVRRFLSVFYPPFVYEQVTMTGTAAGENFAARGKTVVSDGWKVCYEQPEDEDDGEPELKEQRLPAVKNGETLPIERAELTKGRTKPPARFNEATLLAAMENPVRFLQSENAKAAKTLGETGGLGTVATRADIIEKLFHSFLMEKKGNDICLTQKAKQLLELVPEELKQPELTAAWESKLSRIAAGDLDAARFLTDIEAYTRELVQEIRTGDGTFRHDNLTNKLCPDCGKRLLAVNGKNSKMLVCQDRECGYRETVSRSTNARCPKCHKRMELYVKGKEETFVCVCGYKEKLASFKNRREKEGAGVSKRDVQRYLKQQQKQAEEPINSAFASALAGLKLDE